jgi:hypothetical protein
LVIFLYWLFKKILNIALRISMQVLIVNTGFGDQTIAPVAQLARAADS